MCVISVFLRWVPRFMCVCVGSGIFVTCGNVYYHGDLFPSEIPPMDPNLVQELKLLSVDAVFLVT